MKVKVRTIMALIVALLCLTLPTYAAASAPRASITISSQKAYVIEMALSKAELKVRVADLSQAERRAQARITPCLSSALLPIFEAAETEPGGTATRALESLSSEAGAEYVMAVTKPLLNPVLNTARRLLALPLPAKLRSQLKSILPVFAKVQSLNVCADARAWQAAGLGASQEPRGTAQTPVALTDLHKLTESSDKVQVGKLSAAQRRDLKLARARAAKHLKVLSKQADASLESWIVKLVRGLEAAAATQTTTTGTATTGTTTTPATTTGT